MKAILGKKILMTRIFDEKGAQIPVTLVKLENNIVTQIKTKEKDGYEAVQIGAQNTKRLNKPEMGHIKNVAEKFKPKTLYEIKTEKELKIGQNLTVEQFKEGESVSVTGVSKGKGFAGTIKRHNFHLGPKTHGSDNYRRPGSIGATYPERVIKGKRMAGHMGDEKVTVKNVKIVKINEEENVVLLRGPIPGSNNSAVLMWSQNES